MTRPEGYSAHEEKFERRQRGRRYRISAAVAFTWQTPSGELRQSTGISRDISGHGISVVASSIPIPGSPIEVTVNLPVPWARTAMLRGRGVVLRLHPEMGQPWGFAASIEFDEEVDDRDGTECTANSGNFDSLLSAPHMDSRPYVSGLALSSSESDFSDSRLEHWYRKGALA